jgi:hypothetical protein
MTLWIKRPAVIFTVATIAFVGFIIIPVVAAIQNNRYEASALGHESDVNHRGTEFTSDSVSMVPSSTPSDVPSNFPSTTPSDVPSAIPSSVPSSIPSSTPSDVPTSVPTDFVSLLPTTPILSLESDIPSILPATLSTIPPTTLDEMTDVRRKVRRQRVLLNGKD